MQLHFFFLFFVPLLYSFSVYRRIFELKSHKCFVYLHVPYTHLNNRYGLEVMCIL